MTGVTSDVGVPSTRLVTYNTWISWNERYLWRVIGFVLNKSAVNKLKCWLKLVTFGKQVLCGYWKSWQSAFACVIILWGVVQYRAIFSSASKLSNYQLSRALLTRENHVLAPSPYPPNPSLHIECGDFTACAFITGYVTTLLITTNL